MTNDRRMPQIVFTGGGTAGHLFPGLAVAERLVDMLPGLRITFAGCGKPLEIEHVAAAGLNYLTLRSAPWPRRLRDVCRFVVDNFRGYRTAAKYLAEHPVSAVVGLGGYTSSPMARAAIGRRVPLVLLEQNVVPGRVTRWLAPQATAICTSFVQTGDFLPGACCTEHTGNPIRQRFRPSGAQSRQLLILGGSSGAQALNRHVPRALVQLRRHLRDWRIVHQTGPAELQATQDLYESLGLEATVAAFLSDMPQVLATTGLAICRAGGTTLAELAAAAVPAVLVPYPHAADNHQRLNADQYAAAGAAVVLDPRETPEGLEGGLGRVLAGLLTTPPQRAAMSRAMSQMAQPDAAIAVARLIAAVARLPAAVDTRTESHVSSRSDERRLPRRNVRLCNTSKQ